MVEPFHADVAFVAVGSAGWAVEETSSAEFYAKVVSFDGHAVDLRYVAHHAVLVSLVQRNPSEGFVLVG